MIIVQPFSAPKAQPGRPQAARPAEAKADSAAPAPKKPPVKRRRGNPLRQEPDMDQEGLISFFETPGDE